MIRKILYIVAAAWVLAFIWQTYAHAEQEEDEYYCAEVKKTSDGFLAVRKGPDVKAKSIALLRSGFPLAVFRSQYMLPEEQKLYPNWTKWVLVRGEFDVEDIHRSSTRDGYVYAKYIKKVPCK